MKPAHALFLFGVLAAICVAAALALLQSDNVLALVTALTLC
jgi:hypothetical protein